jgi:2'-5' RNA ligase
MVKKLRRLRVRMLQSQVFDKFAGFPKHTIYIGVRDPAPFQQLAKKLKPVAEYISNSGCPSVRLVSQPHFSVARGLSASVYDKAMPYYAQKGFYASFMIEELVLLRRRHQFDKCQAVQVFRFKPAEPVGDIADINEYKKEK